MSVKVYLPFDTSTTEDLCSNSWVANGELTVTNRRLNFNAKGQYLALDGGITLGGKDFTIRGKFNMSSASGRNCRIFSIHNAASTTKNCLNLARQGSYSQLYSDCMSSSSNNFDFSLDAEHDFEYVYVHSDTTVKILVDGVLMLSFTKEIPETTFANVWIGKSNYPADGSFIGYVDEFMIDDGTALHTENFNAVDEDYFDTKISLGGVAYVSYDFCVERKLLNAIKGWRYHNHGDADLLATGGTTVNVDTSKSLTGKAFYGGSQADMFNTPEGLKEVWIRFDVYIPIERRARDGWLDALVYVGTFNSSNNVFTGVKNYYAGYVYTFNRFTLPNGNSVYLGVGTLNRCLLHMISRSSGGLIEFNVNGTTFTYTGNVNSGNDFTRLWIYSESDYTLFSNVVASETEIDLETGYHREEFQTEAEITAPILNVRKQGQTLKFPLKTSRNEIAPAVVVRYGSKNFYNPLVAVNNSNAGDIKLLLNDSTYALSKNF